MRARSASRREVSFRKTEQATSMNSGSTNSHNLDANHFQDYGHMGHQFQQQECLPHRNQRWVHLPVTICEALRAFGAEFNCFLPCRSSCMANNEHGEKEGKPNAGSSVNADGSASSCGAVFARWLVAEKIELVVGEEDREEDDMPRRSQRRHVFEDIVIEGDKCEQKNEILEEDEARVSICIPPKNALLLMRCRSDPVKMAALANRFWECPPPQDEAENENEEAQEEHAGEENQHDRQMKVEQEMEQKQEASSEKLGSHQIFEENKIPDAESETEEGKEEKLVLDRVEEQESQDINEVREEELQNQVQEERQVLDQLELEEETVPINSSSVALADPSSEGNVATLLQETENVLDDKPEPAQEVEKTEAFPDIEEKRRSLSSSSEVFLQPQQEIREDKNGQEAVVVVEDSTEVKETTEKKEEQEEETETTHEEPGDPVMIQEPETGQESKEEESQKQQNLLPDCLLLMMCEPKLSMEVSKETWVCSTDFVRWQPSEKKPPPQTVNKKNGSDEPKKRVSIDANPAQQHQLLMQPPRSSCSFPAAPPLPPALGAPSVKTMNTMIEQKLVGAKPSYEPFALTRCKSEPRKSSAKLAPETCFWKNRKIEPHRPATLGVGAAGVGF